LAPKGLVGFLRQQCAENVHLGAGRHIAVQPQGRARQLRHSRSSLPLAQPTLCIIFLVDHATSAFSNLVSICINCSRQLMRRIAQGLGSSLLARLTSQLRRTGMHTSPPTPTDEIWDCIVVGAGGAHGSAALYHVAKRGAKVGTPVWQWLGSGCQWQRWWAPQCVPVQRRCALAMHVLKMVLSGA
jgi:hypothetical protein